MPRLEATPISILKEAVRFGSRENAREVPTARRKSARSQVLAPSCTRERVLLKRHCHQTTAPMNAEPLPLSPAVLEPDPADRREHPRRTASSLPWLGQARIKYGPEITIIDLSNGGAQIETTGHPLQPGMTLVLEIKEDERMMSVAAQVVRCQLASLTPQAVYRGAVKFKRPLQLPIEPDPNAPARPAIRISALMSARPSVSRAIISWQIPSVFAAISPIR